MWNNKPDERLHEWKAFREKIGQQDINSALKETSQLWSYAPYVAHYLDSVDLEKWPDPWTLLHENHYCDLAKCLGMLYTLYLSSHFGKEIENLEIRVYKNPINQDVFNTVWVNDGKYILNFIFNEIVNKTQIDKKFVLQSRYSTKDLALDLY